MAQMQYLLGMAIDFARHIIVYIYVSSTNFLLQYTESKKMSFFFFTGLQDNPWFCDCRISKLIELSKIVDPQVIFLDPLVMCSGPESLTDILFQKAELEQCLKPSIMTSATKITSPLGSNVLLRCDATGYPTPQLLWSRVNNTNTNYTGKILWFCDFMLLMSPTGFIKHWGTTCSFFPV